LQIKLKELPRRVKATDVIQRTMEALQSSLFAQHGNHFVDAGAGCGTGEGNADGLG
jgi:hypothetical protein